LIAPFVRFVGQSWHYNPTRRKKRGSDVMKHFNTFVLVVAVALLLFIANHAAENGRYQIAQRLYLVDTRTGQLYAPTGDNEKWQVVCGRASEAVKYQTVTKQGDQKEGAK
jgi:hypothetical protein